MITDWVFEKFEILKCVDLKEKKSTTSKRTTGTVLDRKLPKNLQYKDNVDWITEKEEIEHCRGEKLFIGNSSQNKKHYNQIA